MATAAKATPQATTGQGGARNDTMATTGHRSPVAADGVDELTTLYPPGQPPQKRRRGYIDDTLALPPHRLLHGTPPPEAVVAARAKAVERGLIPPAPPQVKRARPSRLPRSRRAAEAAPPPKP